MTTPIEMGEGPADFRFKVAVDGRTEVLVLNFYAINAQMRLDGYEESSGDFVFNKSYVDAFVRAVKATAQPPELAAELTDAVLYAKGNEAFMLFDRLGNAPGPLPTSQRPTGSSMSQAG